MDYDRWNLDNHRVENSSPAFWLLTSWPVVWKIAFAGCVRKRLQQKTQQMRTLYFSSYHRLFTSMCSA